MGMWSFKLSLVTDGSEWCKEAMQDAYVPVPYPEEKLEPMEWMHCLTAIHVCTINHGIKFCDEEGYDIIPIRIISIVEADGHRALIRSKRRVQIMALKAISSEDVEEDFVKPFTL